MTTKAEKLLKDVMKLPIADRADIASCLYGSLDKKRRKSLDDAELHPSWKHEIRRRIREIEQGRVKPIPRAEAMRQIFGDV